MCSVGEDPDRPNSALAAGDPQGIHKNSQSQPGQSEKRSFQASPEPPFTEVVRLRGGG